jgi:hypothetical protein
MKEQQKNAAFAVARMRRRQEAEETRAAISSHRFLLTYKEFLTVFFGVPLVVIIATTLPGNLGSFAYRMVSALPIINLMYALSFIARRSIARREFIQSKESK